MPYLFCVISFPCHIFSVSFLVVLGAHLGKSIAVPATPRAAAAAIFLYFQPPYNTCSSFSHLKLIPIDYKAPPKYHLFLSKDNLRLLPIVRSPCLQRRTMMAYMSLHYVRIVELKYLMGRTHPSKHNDKSKTSKPKYAC